MNSQSIEQNKPECTCGATPEHMGEGIYGKWHNATCPMFDGDHPEICEAEFTKHFTIQNG